MPKIVLALQAGAVHDLKYYLAAVFMHPRRGLPVRSYEPVVIDTLLALATLISLY
ncbi:MAG: hypothetical protein K8R08_06765 [Methanosarcinales archaeon]|nr:hypothetical protein [Methanosarcinales archaeon]MRG76870.1 hypothetical protein [ANME-2 cluster archaeon]